MEQDKYISVGDSYIEIEGVGNDVSQFLDDIVNGKITMKLSTKPLPKTPVRKTPVKLTKKNLKKKFKIDLYTFQFNTITIKFSFQRMSPLTRKFID